MPDDAIFRTFAQEHRLGYRWQTRRDGDRCYARIKVQKGGDTIYEVEANRLSTEQDVLNIVMEYAIKHITAEPVNDVISGWDSGASRRAAKARRSIL